MPRPRKIFTEMVSNVGKEQLEDDESMNKNTDFNEIKEQLDALKKELDILKTQKSALSASEAKALEEARENILSEEDDPVVYLEDKYKDDNYFYRCVDTTRPGRIQKHLKIGYELVQSDDITQTSKSNTSLTSAITAQLGLTRPVEGVWMRIPLEHYNKRQKAKARRNSEVDRSMMQDLVNKADFGSITIGDEIFKK